MINNLNQKSNINETLNKPSNNNNLNAGIQSLSSSSTLKFPTAATDPITITPTTLLTPSPLSNKYNHLALYQNLVQNQNVLYNNNHQLTYPNYLHQPYSYVVGQSAAYNNFNDLNLNVPYHNRPPASSFSHSPTTFNFNQLHPNSYLPLNTLLLTKRSNSVGSNNFNTKMNHCSSISREQDALDDEFMNLLPKNQHSPRHNQNNSNNNNNQHVGLGDNLIDLDTSIEKFNRSTVMDLFDPLYQLPKPTTITLPIKPTQNNPQINVNISQKMPVHKPAVEKIQNTTIEKNKLSFNNINDNSRKPPTVIKTKIEKPTDKEIKSLKLDYCTNIEEFRAYNEFINELKQRLETETSDPSNLITFSPVLECPISKKVNIKISARYAIASGNNEQINKKYQTISLLVSIKATVETLVYNVLNLFNIDDLDTKKYLLKIHGLEEYLPIESTLADLKYIHECLIENKEPVLVLVEVKNANTDLNFKKQNLEREEKNDESSKFKFCLNFNYDYFDESTQSLFSKVDSVLSTILNHKKSLLDALGEYIRKNSSNLIDLILNWLINLKERARALVLIFNGLNAEQINFVLEKLEFFEKRLKSSLNRKIMKEKQPLMGGGDYDDDYGYQIEKNGCSVVSSSDIFEQLLHFASKTLLLKIQQYLNLVCKSFYFPYTCINNNNEPEPIKNIEDKKIDIFRANDESFFIYFNGLIRLTQFFTALSPVLNSNSDLYLKFSLMYGTRQLDHAVIKLEKLYQKKPDSFFKKCKIQFDKFKLNYLPRESYLLIQIYTTSLNISNPALSQSFYDVTKINNNEKIDMVSSSKNKIDNKLLDRCLGWTTKTIFNDQSVFMPGEDSLLVFFERETPLPISTTVSNVYSNKMPMIQITLADYDYFYAYIDSGDLFKEESEADNKSFSSEQANDFHSLSPELRERLLEICNKNIIANNLTESDRQFVYQNYSFLNAIPNALAKIYLSFPAWHREFMFEFYSFLKQTELLSLSESLELLLPCFPDFKLRAHAVRSLEKQYSPEILSLYLPQLLEAVKYEYSNKSPLVAMLLSCASKNISFAHKMFWHLKEFKSRSGESMLLRYYMIYDTLLYFFNKQMLDEIELEEYLVKRIDQIGLKIKETKDIDQLYNDLENFCNEWKLFRKSQTNCCRLPYNVSYCTREIDVRACSSISSFTMPLKLVFKNVDPTAHSFYTIYKIGDDLRQDMFVLQLINVMNQLWLSEDLDLSVLTFTCLQTGSRRGFIEMITNAETLKEIQKGTVVNAFKKNCINDWLRSHNPNFSNFKLAIENFTKSCAAYSVATYILGIGDRHNDNIMIKYTGHLFHIDFGKYLGDAQTFAGFKRDRTPILFTSDMFYCINQGKDPSFRFQVFIDYCCKAFQILRKNYHHLLSLINLVRNIYRKRS